MQLLIYVILVLSDIAGKAYLAVVLFSAISADFDVVNANKPQHKTPQKKQYMHNLLDLFSKSPTSFLAIVY